MTYLKHLFAKYTQFFVGALAHLGIWGPCVIALADAAAIGIPMDPVIGGYAWKARDNLWLVAFYVFSAALSSALGSLVPYWIGRGGGEPLLLKRISHKRLEELRDRYESWEFFFVMVPSMLPPPTPFKLFVLAAGAFEMRVSLFITAIFLGRLLRFGLVSFLVIRYGQAIASTVAEAVGQHLSLVMGGIVVGLLIGYLVWMRRRNGTKPLPD